MSRIFEPTRFWLVDAMSALVECWQREFAEWPEVTPLCGNILPRAQCCLVSPANSMGLMDGGIDDAYIDFFGPQLQRRVLVEIDRRGGELPVGAAVLVETGHDRVPWLIVAPTMERPGPVPPANSFFAMAAILQVAKRYETDLTDIYCPGLATGTGRVGFDDAAREMAAAFRKWKGLNAPGYM